VTRSERPETSRREAASAERAGTDVVSEGAAAVPQIEDGATRCHSANIEEVDMNSRDGEVPADSEAGIEQKLQDRGLNAPRLTPEQIDGCIVGEDYYVFPGTTLTVCCLKLENGFCVVGESAAASPENFDVEVGQTISRRNARDKIWSLEGYLLKSKLYACEVRKENAVTEEQAQRTSMQGGD